MTSPTHPWIVPCTLECPGVTRTIRLEPLEIRHAPDLCAVADRELFRHTMQAPDEWSPRGFAEEMERLKARPGVIAFAIVLASGPDAGRAIGRTAFVDIKPEHRALEIGWTWIGRAYHSTRVNPEAKYMMLRHAFETLAPTAIRVQLTTSGTNLHSQAAIAKLGAVREGVLRHARIMSPSATRPEPVISDWIVYSIIEAEWPQVKSRLEQRLRDLP